MYNVISLHIVISFFVYFRDIFYHDSNPWTPHFMYQLGHKQMFKMPVAAATSAYSMIATIHIYKKPSLSILSHVPYLATAHPALNVDDFQCCTGCSMNGTLYPHALSQCLFFLFCIPIFRCICQSLTSQEMPQP